MTSTDDSSTTITDDTSSSSRPTSNHSAARIAAIRELIQTEQIYVRDLRTIANDFIKPLNNNRVINDYEIENVFCNWFNLIACNTVLLTSLQEQVHYREQSDTLDWHASIRTLRSASMSNIALSAQVRIGSSILLRGKIICFRSFRNLLEILVMLPTFLLHRIPLLIENPNIVVELTLIGNILHHQKFLP